MNCKRLPCIVQNFIDPSVIMREGSFVWHFAVLQARVRLGERSIIWHGARILSDVVIGNDCMVGGGTEIGRGSTIGDKTRIGANCFLPSNSVVGRRVFIGPNVTCTDDRHPIAGNTGYTAEPPIIEDEASIGAGAVILPGIRIGSGAIIGAGSIVTKDVEPYMHVRGQPARETVLSPDSVISLRSQPMEPIEGMRLGQ